MTETIDRAAIVRRTLGAVRALPRRSVPPVRAIRKALSAELRTANARDVITIGEALARQEPRWLGYEIITKHRAALASLTLRQVERIAILDSWYAVDAFGLYIAGPALRDGQIGLAAVKRWARSTDFWWRRAALVATVPLNQRSHGNGFRTADTLAICAQLIDDREDMVVKALSWALRVLASRDPNAVREFLDAYEGRIAARARRETNTKLATGTKNKPKARKTAKPRRTGRSTSGS